jgi:hypothetical protein
MLIGERPVSLTTIVAPLVHSIVLLAMLTILNVVPRRATLANLVAAAGLVALVILRTGIEILRELVRDRSANAKTRGNLAMLYGLAGREREAAATLQGDLSPGEIQQNLAYYRELRVLLAQGKPIGNLQQ